MHLSEPQRQLIEDYQLIENPTERLTILMDQAGKRKDMSPGEMIEENRVTGCLSQVWVIGDYREACCHYRSEADSGMVKALVQLLCDFYSGHSPQAILSTEPQVIEALGLDRQLSPTRLQGLQSVTATIKAYAQRCLH